MPGGQLPRGVPDSAGHAGHATLLLALLTHYFLLLTFFRACPALPRSWRRAAWSPWGWCRTSGWPAAPAPCRRRRSSWAAGWRGGRGSASGTWGVYHHVNMAGTIVEKEQLENYQGPNQQPQQHQHQQPTTFPTQPTMWWQQQRAYIHNVAIVTMLYCFIGWWITYKPSHLYAAYTKHGYKRPQEHKTSHRQYGDFHRAQRGLLLVSGQLHVFNVIVGQR